MKIENVRRELDGLKEAMLEYHRSAAILDSCIQSIELELIGQEEQPDQEYLETKIQSYRVYCGNHRRQLSLEEREDAAWEKIYNSIKEEEET